MNKPKIGTTCPALVNEDYTYHLSGDLGEYCLCSITGYPCLGKVIGDPDDRSSHFFGRGRCGIDSNAIKRCPLYGASKETLKVVLTDKAKKEYTEKINQF